ncbi:MAG: helix-turn-helix domain-containing protein [Chloroflexota bacterium]|nr:helix-turn-helix domain-containing protein [Chloroflexota bacterium]
MEDRTKLLLTEEQAAAALGFTRRFLQNRRVTGDGPPFCRISARAIRYRPEDLETWIQARMRTSTSDTGEGA